MILDPRQPSNAGGPSTSYRLKRGTKASELPPYPPLDDVPGLSSFNGPFQLAEYLALKVRLNPHDVDALVELPQEEGGHGPTKAVWILEHLRRIPIDLTPLLVALIGECTRETCPQMKADEWLYLCVAHGTNETEECCAIDYILHTVDSASATLNSTKFFPSRLSVPVGSEYGFPSMCRRLCRIFSHAYFHHREIFSLAEAETSLYARFVALCERYDLVGGKLFVIPREVVQRRRPGASQVDVDEEGEDTGREPRRGTTTRQLVDTASDDRAAESSRRDADEDEDEEDEEEEENDEEDDEAPGRASRSLSSTEGKERRTQSLDRNPLPDLVDLSGGASGSKRPDREDASAVQTLLASRSEDRRLSATAQKLDFLGLNGPEGTKELRGIWRPYGEEDLARDNLESQRSDHGDTTAAVGPSSSGTIRPGRSRSGSVVTAIHEADEGEPQELSSEKGDPEPQPLPSEGKVGSETEPAEPQGSPNVTAAVGNTATETEEDSANVGDLGSAIDDIKLSEDAAEVASLPTDAEQESSASLAPESADRQAAEVPQPADEAAPSNNSAAPPSSSSAEQPPTTEPPAQLQPQKQPQGKTGGKGNQGGKHKGGEAAKNGKSPRKLPADGAAAPPPEANKSDDPDSPERKDSAS